MPIHSIKIGNFKGIADTVTIPIKPITIFIGENSSGKSTVLHALAALSQTVSLPNDTRALILDDEFAYVHLGRFIDVIHSRKYTDTMTLGVNVGKHQIRRGKDASNDVEAVEVEIEGTYEFKSTKRTQDISVSNGEVKAGDDIYKIRKSLAGISVENVAQKTITRGTAGSVLRDRVLPPPRKHGFDFVAYNLAQRAIVQALKNTFYLGPFRQSPRRSYPTRGATPRQVGPEGEATIPLLANEVVQSKSRPHIHQIAAWLAAMKLGSKLEISRVAASDLFHKHPIAV